MAVGSEYVVGFFENPKLIHVASGNTEHIWQEIDSGKQQCSIHRVSYSGALPPVAMDPLNTRFAVADKDSITIVQLRV